MAAENVTAFPANPADILRTNVRAIIEARGIKGAELEQLQGLLTEVAGPQLQPFEQISRAHCLLLTCAASYGDDGAIAPADLVPIQRTLEIAIEMMADAARVLDDNVPTALWEAIDVATCALVAIEHGYEAVRTVTQCPPQGALRVAARLATTAFRAAKRAGATP